MSERGKIRARRVTGNCVQHQRDVATAVKNAREMALLPVLEPMKIILQKPVDKLGEPGDIAEVADGYARNYLIPGGSRSGPRRAPSKQAETLKRAHVPAVQAEG